MDAYRMLDELRRSWRVTISTAHDGRAEVAISHPVRQSGYSDSRVFVYRASTPDSAISRAWAGEPPDAKE